MLEAFARPETRCGLGQPGSMSPTSDANYAPRQLDALIGERGG